MVLGPMLYVRGLKALLCLIPIGIANRDRKEGSMRKALLAVLAVCVCMSLTSWAQDTATIVGTVVDSSGAVIPNATVTVSNPDRGYVRNLETNSAGEYTA